MLIRRYTYVDVYYNENEAEIKKALRERERLIVSGYELMAGDTAEEKVHEVGDTAEIRRRMVDSYDKPTRLLIKNLYSFESLSSVSVINPHLVKKPAAFSFSLSVMACIKSTPG